MFDSMLVSSGVGVPARSRWVLPVSVLSHVAAIGLLVVTAFMVTVSPSDPGLPVVFAAPALAPPAPPPPPPPGPPASDLQPQVEEVVPEPEEMLQPQEVPESPSLAPSAGSTMGGEGGPPEGVPGGQLQLGGVPGGDGDEPGASGPIVITPDMTPPVLKRKVEPEYPEIPRKLRQQGRVILQAVISTAGTVEGITVLRSSDSSDSLFEQAAIDAVRQWEYEPALQRGRPVTVYFTVYVVFSLN
jgi:protein TonB